MLEKSESLAEMLGIILGDGRLRWDPTGRHYQLDVILNWVEEKDYVLYVNDLMMRLFQYKPKLSRQINEDGSIGKGIYLTIYSKKLVYELISLGLIPGNKVENQIKVPKWIKECKSYMIACLKGLFDTDGSIFPVIKEGAIKMNFKNGSLSLVEDFKEMTELFEIKTSKISSYSEITEKTNEFSITFILQIQARNQVKKFLDIINPMKWEYRKEYLLKIITNPFDYTMEYYSDSDIENWILLYEKFKSYRLVSECILKEQGKSPKIDTIRLRIKKYFGEKYEKWLKDVKSM